ncbi:MAG: SPFH domain-containing protein [Angelakisella sp.]
MAIIDIIKSSGKSELLAWKYPCGELINWTQLIVNEGEEAVLFVDGKAADRFTAGRYTLRTANLPMLQSLIKLPFGGKSPFAAELWYLNTGGTLDIKWGTDAPICPHGDCEGLPLSLRGYGLLGVRISDAVLFLSSLRGQLADFDRRTVAAYLRSRVAQSVCDSIAAAYSKDVTARQLAEQINIHAAPLLMQYGLEPTCLIISDLHSSGSGDSGNNITFSVMSVIIAPKNKGASDESKGTAPTRQSPRRPIIAVGAVLFLLLMLVFVFLLAPGQLCDFAGIASVGTAHCAVVALLLWLWSERHGLLVTIGFSVTAALYWLGAIGTALIFRLFSIADAGLLMVLQLAMAAVAALVLVSFWYGRVYDSTEIKEEAGEDETEA